MDSGMRWVFWWAMSWQHYASGNAVERAAATRKAVAAEHHGRTAPQQQGSDSLAGVRLEAQVGGNVSSHLHVGGVGGQHRGQQRMSLAGAQRRVNGVLCHAPAADRLSR